MLKGIRGLIERRGLTNSAKVMVSFFLKARMQSEQALYEKLKVIIS